MRDPCGKREEEKVSGTDTEKDICPGAYNRKARHAQALLSPQETCYTYLALAVNRLKHGEIRTVVVRATAPDVHCLGEATRSIDAGNGNVLTLERSLGLEEVRARDVGALRIESFGKGLADTLLHARANRREVGRAVGPVVFVVDGRG